MDKSLIISALALGFAGSLHCTLMCGPIVSAIQISRKLKLQLFIHNLLYNLGRVLCYTILGALFASLGRGLQLVGLQQKVSLFIGIILILGMLTPKRIRLSLFQKISESSYAKKVRQSWAPFLRQAKGWNFFVIGLLNGLLPCGLVYVALAGAIASPSPYQGAAFMALFGSATIPALLVIGLFSQSIFQKIKGYEKVVIPLACASLAILFILRGLNLDIPYISPDLSQATEAPTCCSGQ